MLQNDVCNGEKWEKVILGVGRLSLYEICVFLFVMQMRENCMLFTFTFVKEIDALEENIGV